MADLANDPDGRDGSSGGSIGSFILILLLLTLLGGGIGAVAGLHFTETVRKAVAGQAATAPEEPDLEQIYLAPVRLRELKPLVTNLAAPREAWVRLQASVVIDQEGIDDVIVLLGYIEEDVLAYMRTVTLAQIEGAAGLQHLREDLNERARARSGGKVRELILESLVVQ
ncbi:flagellar basal body-associated FliL family protein [Pannonibacter sp. Pt2]|uniref:Flagellar protein FliL n=1 Tax=Pannonibacter anstelovis TaxID=3121537 RepID=A0ABU7ZSJ0_9HYPH